MTEEKQGAAEWLREKAWNLRGMKEFNCKEFMAHEFNASCNGRRCVDCYIDMFERIADRIEPEADELRGLRDENEKLRGKVRERQLPEGIEWPRFEDGGLVRIGDELEFEGKTMLVCDATFYADDWAFWCDREDMSGRLYGKYGERVKRPAPKVLDADGVPIKVGDTVYGDDDPEQLIVDSFDGPGCVCLTLAKSPSGMLYTIEPSRLSHERPDNWEKLEKDAMGRACELAGSGHLRCGDCEWGKEGIGCQAMARLEILKRAKKLAGIEEEAQR